MKSPLCSNGSTSWRRSRKSPQQSKPSLLLRYLGIDILGLRLAFDKPTIIVKDDKTSYSFDTAPIEHLQYPRDLRFSLVVEFKKKLAEKIRATFAKATSDSSYTTFL